MPCDSIDVILAAGRVSVLVLGLLVGAFCIYLGWALYRENVRSQISGELKYNSIKLVIKTLGPGVFLALFGAFIVFTIVGQQLDLSTREERPTNQKQSTYRQSWNADPPRLLLAADNPAASVRPTCPACPECLVIIKTRRYLHGEAPTTREEFARALDAALAAMTSSLSATDSNAERAKIRTHIRALEEMSAGLVK